MRHAGWALALLLLLLLTAASGCGTAEDPVAAAPEAAGAISLELVTRIGCADCDDDTAITPTVVTFLTDGRVAVLDRYEPFVRIFDESGDLDLAFGQKGQGPGELGLAAGSDYLSGVFLFPEPGGGVSVVDVLPPIVETFDAAGNFVHQAPPLDLPGPIPSSQAYSVTTRTYFRLGSDPFSDGEDMIGRCRLGVDHEARCDRFSGAESLFAGPDGTPRADRPEGYLSFATTSDGELVIADDRSYWIWIVDDEATIARAFRHDVPFSPKTEEELDAERATNERLVARGLRSREIVPHRNHMARNGLQVDGADRIWVLTQRYDPENSVLDIFDVDGTFLHEIAIPSVIRFDGYQITPFVISGHRLAAMARQPDESTRIDVYEIVER